MVAVISEIVGGVLISTILMGLLLYIFRKLGLTNRLICLAVSAVVTLAGVTVLAGYGFADGGPPVFLLGYYKYSGPVLFATLLHLLNVVRIQKRTR